MKLAVFGLTVSSSWGNGHATVWRGLLRALAARGHETVFFERDVPWYARHRDLRRLEGGRLVLYRGWDEVETEARAALRDADAAIVTSYCADASVCAERIAESRVPVKIFYDLDSPVTLDRLDAGDEVPWIGARALRDFDLVLSFAGGPALERLRTRLGARRAEPLYGAVDPGVHRPSAPRAALEGDLSFLGTYAADRQEGLEALFLAPARRLPGHRFVLAGAQFPPSISWPANVMRLEHLPPADHGALFCSSPLTLSVTRGPMIANGYCPSGRLFEAAACGIPVLSDRWPGIESFFEPGREILLATTTDEAIEAIARPAADLLRIGADARRRALAEHTASARADRLLGLVEEHFAGRGRRRARVKAETEAEAEAGWDA